MEASRAPTCPICADSASVRCGSVFGDIGWFHHWLRSSAEQVVEKRPIDRSAVVAGRVAAIEIAVGAF